jgi:hypothetical protein
MYWETDVTVPGTLSSSKSGIIFRYPDSALGDGDAYAGIVRTLHKFT